MARPVYPENRLFLLPTCLKAGPAQMRGTHKGTASRGQGSPRYKGISGAQVNEDAVPTMEQLRHSADVGLVLLQALRLLFLFVSRVSLTSLGTGASSPHFPTCSLAGAGGPTLRVSRTPDGTQLTVCGLCFLRL